jgi:hypothetical protein
MVEERSMRALIEAVAGPREWSDTRGSWLNRAARRSGLSFRTIKSIWYGQIRDESHHAVRLLRHTAEQRAAQQYETIARSLQAIDPEFHSPRITQYLALARALRDLESSQGAREGNAEGFPGEDWEG